MMREIVLSSADFVTVIRKAASALAATAGAERLRLEADLSQVKRDHAKLVDAIIAGVPADQVKDRMQTLDARRQQLEVQISHAAERPDPVRIHPSMAATYRERVSALIRGLGHAEQMDEAKEARRDLVEKVILVPSADGSHLEIELQGALAGLLRLAVGLPVGGMPDGKNGKASAIADSQGIDMIEELVLVAGTGFEPVTFRL
jgi:site-specific DNA recombinase